MAAMSLIVGAALVSTAVAVGPAHPADPSTTYNFLAIGVRLRTRSADSLRHAPAPRRRPFCRPPTQIYTR